MKPSQILRPTLPKGYVDHPISEVAWEHVEERLNSIHELLDLYRSSKWTSACDSALGSFFGRKILL